LLESLETSRVHVRQFYMPLQASKYPHACSYLQVRSEVGRVHFSSCLSDRASDIFSLNRY